MRTLSHLFLNNEAWATRISRHDPQFFAKQAALRDDRLGLSDNWLRHVKDVREKHETWLMERASDGDRCDRLCELNVIEQVMNVCQTTIALDAWERGQELAVHGWIYGLHNGLLHDLNVTTTGPQQTASAYRAAISALNAN